ncbi:MarR family winged helix-turn-helix transcriptional regulator [Paenirhodobacter sp.]|uniref:MarR family winged helix-turn-helix transcriptional regulator n=1 Tax=Paenirhodobacter sp. TaxID=1965326 RepID=UPI003B414C86
MRAGPVTAAAQDLGLTQSPEAQRTSLDKVQVSRAASRLEEKGLIDRAILSSDRRLPTEAGRALFQQVFAEVSGRAVEILSLMPPEDREAFARGDQMVRPVS